MTNPRRALCTPTQAAAHVKTWPGVGEWHRHGLGLLLGSFGTLSVLLFARPEAEAIKFWNLIAGHILSVAVVMTVLFFMGPSILSRAVAMGLAICAMLWTDSVHPPGGEADTSMRSPLPSANTQVHQT